MNKPGCFILLVISGCLLTACSMTKPTLPVLPATKPVSPSKTSPTATHTPFPSATSTPIISFTPTFLPVTPVFQGTPLPEHGSAISLDTVERLSLIARWGLGNPEQVAPSPDGKYYIVGTSTGLYIYNPVNFSLIHYIDIASAVFHLAISSDGKILAAVTPDHVHLYRMEDFQLINIFKVDANSVDFSPDAKLIALGVNTDPNRLQLRDVTSGTILSEFVIEQGASAVQFSPGGDYIAMGGYSTTVIDLEGDITTQIGPYVSGGHTSSVSFSPDGNYLADGSDYEINVWRVLSNGRLNIYREFDLSQFNFASVFDVAISPNGMLIAAALSNGVYAWDIASGSRIFEAPTPVDYIHYNSLTWSMDNETILTTSIEAGVQVYNLRLGKTHTSLTQFSGTLSSLVWTPDGQMLAAGAEEGKIHLLNVKDGTVIQQFGSGYELNSLAISPDGQSLAAGYNDQIIDFWTMDAVHMYSLEGFGYGSTDATFSTDGSFFAASLQENWQTPNQVRLWNTRDWRIEKTFSVGDRENFIITGFALAPDQRTGAISYVDESGSYQKDMIKVISIADGTLLITLEPKMKVYRVLIESIVYSPDSKFLAALVSEFFDPNPRILIWQTSDWAIIYEQTILRNGQRLGWAKNLQDSITWSPDGKLLVVGMADGSIRVLNADNGRELSVLTGHSLAVVGVAFSPDGRILASSSVDGTVMLWSTR